MDIAFEDHEQAVMIPATQQTNTQDKIYISSKEEISIYLPDPKDRLWEKKSGFGRHLIYYLRDSKDGTFAYVHGEKGEVYDGAPTYNSNYGIVISINVDLFKTSLLPIAGEPQTYAMTPSNSTDSTENQNPNQNNNSDTSNSIQFSDVKFSDWYYDSVNLAVESGLMQGISEEKFDPHGDLTIAQAITLAARTHHNFNKTTEPFAQQKPWYKTYTDYAIVQQIIGKDDFPDYNLRATRAEMAYIFANALPDSAYEELKQITNLPDVDHTTVYAQSIFKLYSAGILKGSNDQGVSLPCSAIKPKKQRCSCPSRYTPVGKNPYFLVSGIRDIDMVHNTIITI